MTIYRRGNCYAASEALFHILGGKACGWTPMWMPLGRDNHWFLKHRSGLILDPSRRQFTELPDYSKARGCGFLTKKPSLRATVLIDQLTYESINSCFLPTKKRKRT